MKLKPFIKGLLTFVPGSRLILPKKKPGGDNTASYCYDIWLKHLTLLWENGLRSIPDTVAEIGPGDSLGVGIAALLSGVNNYYALDILHYATTELNLEIFDGLVDLFKRRAKRPSKGWPDFDSYLDENLFPSHILTDKILNSALSEQRIRSIRRLISSSSNPLLRE